MYFFKYFKQIYLIWIFAVGLESPQYRDVKVQGTTHIQGSFCLTSKGSQQDIDGCVCVFIKCLYWLTSDL